MSNTQGYIPVQIHFEDAVSRMEKYDALPSEYRALLRDAPFNLNFERIRASVEEYTETINEIKRDATMRTYGSNHPDLLES